MVMPVGVCTPPTDACMATVPVGTLAGSWMVIWYSPTVPVVRTELTTGTCIPLTVTIGIVDVAGALLIIVPAAVGGFVGPNPVPHSTTRSPGCAGVVDVTGV